MKLLSGEVSAASGVLSLPASKRVVLFQPTIPKEAHIYSVKSFLEQNMTPDDLKNSSAIVSKVRQANLLNCCAVDIIYTAFTKFYYLLS